MPVPARRETMVWTARAAGDSHPIRHLPAERCHPHIGREDGAMAPTQVHEEPPAGSRAPAPRRRPPGAKVPRSRWDVSLFRVALAVIAVSVLDDAFWHREPGTSVSDHLAGGLAPVALA